MLLEGPTGVVTVEGFFRQRGRSWWPPIRSKSSPGPRSRGWRPCCLICQQPHLRTFDPIRAGGRADDILTPVPAWWLSIAVSMPIRSIR